MSIAALLQCNIEVKNRTPVLFLSLKQRCESKQLSVIRQSCRQNVIFLFKFQISVKDS